MNESVDERLRDALTALLPGLTGRPWPPCPPGFVPLAPARAMRAVLGGPLPGREGPVDVVLKVNRPLTFSDRLARRLRGGRGPREARVLAALRAAGLPAAEPLAAEDRTADVLVTRRLHDLAPLPPAASAPRALVEQTARALARLFRAGLVHRDLTAANLLLHHGQPTLLDAGGARIAAPTPRRARTHLAQAAHGFLWGASRATRLRALRAWLDEAGLPGAWRAWLPGVTRALARRERRHRRHRERRTLRSGRHFAVFHAPGLAGVRRTQAPAAWEQLAGSLAAGVPPGCVALPGSSRVHRTRLPGLAQEVVLKHYAPTRGGRTPRALTAFARAVALEERGLLVPRALAAAAGPAGSVLVSEHLEAQSVHALLAGCDGASRPSARELRSLARALGRTLAALHGAEVAHRDLKPQNLLALRHGASWRVALADLDGARPRYGPVPLARRTKDLGRLAASLRLSGAARLRVLEAYRAASPGLGAGLRGLAEAVHARAQAQRARLRTRYGPQAVPRT